MKQPIRIAITGAAGQICYSLIFRIASGNLFGNDQPIILQLIEVPQALDSLQGLIMELEDCAFPLLQGVFATADLDEGFKNANWCLLVGSVPRKAGMERKDLLTINGSIFVKQGQAIERNAASDVRILVVGNPCNTNCLIAMNNAKKIPQNRWFAMTKLDENRAKAQLAIKSNQKIEHIQHVAIWGNHSATQYPDFFNATINNKPSSHYIDDDNWVKNTFIPTVQQRGAAVIKARGASSAASAANAIIDTVKSIHFPTQNNEWHSVAVCSNGSYDIPQGLIFSFPIRSSGKDWEIIPNIELNTFAREKILLSTQELQEEQSAVKELGLID